MGVGFLRFLATKCFTRETTFDRRRDMLAAETEVVPRKGHNVMITARALAVATPAPSGERRLKKCSS